VRLRDIKPEDVQRLISVALETGYSTQTAKHIGTLSARSFLTQSKRDAFWAASSHSGKSAWHAEKNSYALTFEQMVNVLQAMRYPEWEMALIAILTGMNIAEICGLQWKFVNLTDHLVNREGS